MEQKLLGKVALVTGAARGIGRVYALRLAQLGADVVINDIQLEPSVEGETLTSTVMDEIRVLGRRSIGIETDVTKKKDVNAMFDTLLNEFGRLDILVNNAGGSRPPLWIQEKYAPESEEYFRYMFDRNFMGTMFCCQAASVPMKKQRSGKIVNVGSDFGISPEAQDNQAVPIAYGVAKCAVIFYTRILALQLGPYGIHVNCIAPAHIATSPDHPWLNERREETIKARRITLQRIGVPEDCAKVVEFLTTDLSDYMTGQVVSVCGGTVKSPS